MPDDFTSPHWQRLRLEILERDGYQCQIHGSGTAHTHALKRMLAD